MSDDWKDDNVKQMEDNAEDDMLRCTRCGEPYFEHEGHDDCKNDEDTATVRDIHEDRERRRSGYDELFGDDDEFDDL